MSALLQVQNVTKRFGGLTANHDVSFDVQENEILSVIGPNGAGKSTLFKMISSFLPTTSGQVLFKGWRISNRKPHIAAWPTSKSIGRASPCGSATSAGYHTTILIQTREWPARPSPTESWRR